MSGGGSVTNVFDPMDDLDDDFQSSDREHLIELLSVALDQLETEIERLAERAGAETRESRGIALDVLRQARETLQELEQRG